MDLKLLLPWILFISCSQGSIPHSGPSTVIAIEALDCNKDIDLQLLANEIAQFYHCKCLLLKSSKLPGNAWYTARQRYRADTLLNFLDHQKTDDFNILLGVTSKDISTSVEGHKDWGVFGLGRCPGHVCVISDFRLHKAADNKIVQTRLKNVALHEIGHNLGLLHCGDKNCLMKDANGKLSSVEGSNRDLCRRCHERIYD